MLTILVNRCTEIKNVPSVLAVWRKVTESDAWTVASVGVCYTRKKLVYLPVRWLPLTVDSDTVSVYKISDSNITCIISMHIINQWWKFWDWSQNRRCQCGLHSSLWKYILQYNINTNNTNSGVAEPWAFKNRVVFPPSPQSSYVCQATPGAWGGDAPTPLQSAKCQLTPAPRVSQAVPGVSTQIFHT